MPRTRRQQDLQVREWLTQHSSGALTLQRPTDPNGHPCTHDELRSYAKSLAARSASDVSASSSADTDADTTVRAEGWAARSREGPLGLVGAVEEAERELSCREAVEILTRNPKKREWWCCCVFAPV